MKHKDQKVYVGSEKSLSVAETVWNDRGALF